LDVEIDGILHPSIYISPVEARVPVSTEVKGGFHDLRISTDLGVQSIADIVPRYPALKCTPELPLGGQLAITLNNGEQGSFILAFSNLVYPTPALFENFGWFYGLELNGVWMLNAGIFGVDDFVRQFVFNGPTSVNMVGTDFYLQAWTFQGALGLIGFTNAAKTTIVP
jgi:hypothetical protein